MWVREQPQLKRNNPELVDVDLSDDRHWVDGRCRVTAHDVIFGLRC